MKIKVTIQCSSKGSKKYSNFVEFDSEELMDINLFVREVGEEIQDAHNTYADIIAGNKSKEKEE